MTLLVTTEQRMIRDGRGVWTTSGFHAGFWARYRRVFDAVTVVARTSRTEMIPDGSSRVDADGVTVVDLPDYHGVMGYLTARREVVRRLRAALSSSEAAILRVPSPIGMVAASLLHKASRPYAVEVVGDPYDVFAPGGVQHPSRPILRQLVYHQMRRACADAAAAAYVTRETLQRRYPCGRRPTRAWYQPFRRDAVETANPEDLEAVGQPFTASYSSVELPDEAFVTRPPSIRPTSRMHIVTVGTLSQPYKGQDVLIRAIARCAAVGADVHVTVVGDGAYRPAVERLTEGLGLASRVRFAGHVSPASAVRRELDTADLFVLPSRTEGLPRGLIEAMARGLPAIGTTVGGIPELLDPVDMVPPDDAGRLADLILEFHRSPERRRAAGARNLREAQQYHDRVLTQRRDAFYARVRSISRGALHADRLEAIMTTES